MKKQIVLGYHSIGDSVKEIGAEMYCIPTTCFRKQIELIQDKDALITFDDGDITNYDYALPVLEQFNQKAYFFIIGGYVGKDGYMDIKQIKELHQKGHIIGSHGMAHRILTDLKNEELEYELKESKKILEDKLKHPVEYFSVPRGFYNRRVIEKIKEAGYKAVFTSNAGDNDGFKFGRIAVKGDWDLNRFSNAINNKSSLKDKTKELIKYSSKFILGAKRYDKIRTKILTKK